MKKFLWRLSIIIVACIAGIAAFVGLTVFVERMIAPANYLFYEQHPVAGVAMIWLIMLPVILVCGLLVGKLRKKTLEQMEEINDIVYYWNHLGSVRSVAIILWSIGMYCCMISVTFVTEDSIVYHSPLHPEGIGYEYSDVEKITTGFGNKNFAFVEYKKKGNFYYQIRVDGKYITFHVPSVNEAIEKYEDSYLELEEFDQILVNMGIAKEGSAQGYENCELDSRYVERFLRIVGNITKKTAYGNLSHKSGN